MKATFFISDLELLSKLFLPKDVICHVENENKTLIQDPVLSTIHSTSKNANALCLLPNSKEVPDLSKYPFIIDFKGTTSTQHKTLTFGYLTNPDGSIRWIYPSWRPNSGFLSFYNVSNFKSMLLAAGIKYGFKLGLHKFIRSGSFSIHYSKPLNQTIENLLNSQVSFSIFTGTVGISRKIQIEINRNGETKYFIKMPFSKQSEKNIECEKKHLHEVRMLNLTRTSIPNTLHSNEKQQLITENIRHKNASVSPTFNDSHTQALKELYSKTFHNLDFHTSKFHYHILEKLDWLESCKNFKFDKHLISSCRELLTAIPHNTVIGSSYAHRDFTSWNMFTDENTLFLFDWESAEKEIPMLYDFFHFHFQKGILIDRKKFPDILKEIQLNLQKTEMHNIVSHYKINVQLHLALYVIAHVSEYLVLYQKQDRLHKQVSWLVDTWNEALDYLKVEFSHDGIRNYLIADFIEQLQPYPYTWMKAFGKSIFQLSEHSDIDLLIEKKDLNNILEILNRYAPFSTIKIVRKSFMTTVSIYFHNQDFLSIDLIYEFKRKQNHFLDARKILAYAGVNAEGVKVPQLLHDLEYILMFYTLNNDVIPKHYSDHFLSVTETEQKAMLLYLKMEYKLYANSLKEILENNLMYKNQLKTVIQKTFYSNNPFSKIKSAIDYLLDTAREIILNRGYILTVSGVDGAGKSTIIESLKYTFEKKYRKKVTIIRHRPSLLPILSSYVYGKEEAENKIVNSLPRQGKNSNVWSSAARFLYYYSDYQVGQIYVWIKYILRGHIVIYDRYYFDFIEDSRRTNIKLPNSITSFLYKFIHKPKLNVLLYAMPEVILARKKELSEDDILKMNASYLKLFQKLSSTYKNSSYVSIENIHKETTIQQIMKRVPLAY